MGAVGRCIHSGGRWEGREGEPTPATRRRHSNSATDPFPYAGFSSINFDLSGNLGSSSSPGGAGGTGGGGETAADRDARTGLDERTLTEVRRIMDRQRVGFDEARRIHVERMFRKNGASGPGGWVGTRAKRARGGVGGRGWWRHHERSESEMRWVGGGGGGLLSSNGALVYPSRSEISTHHERGWMGDEVERGRRGRAGWTHVWAHVVR